MEEVYLFDHFHEGSPVETTATGTAQVMVMGQYSSGKTSLIRHLLGEDFPSMNISPEPSTDKFTILLHGHEASMVTGHSLALLDILPFERFQTLHRGALDSIAVCTCSSAVLERLTIIDCPGFLPHLSEYQRPYDPLEVASWFAMRSDIVIVMFSAHTLDASSEVFEVLKSLNLDKVRIVLNKAAHTNHEELMRVYGTLMWKLGEVFGKAEVVRVYIGSFWNGSHTQSKESNLLQASEKDLALELMQLPFALSERKMNSIVCRAIKLKALACLFEYLRKSLPRFWGKQAVQDSLVENMTDVFQEVTRMNCVQIEDMPNFDSFVAKVAAYDFSTLPRLRSRDLGTLDGIIYSQFPKIVREAGGADRVFRLSSAGANISPKHARVQSLFGTVASKTSSMCTEREQRPTAHCLPVKKNGGTFRRWRMANLFFALLALLAIFMCHSRIFKERECFSWFLSGMIGLGNILPSKLRYRYSTPEYFDRQSRETEQEAKPSKENTELALNSAALSQNSMLPASEWAPQDLDRSSVQIRAIDSQHGSDVDEVMGW